LFIDLSKTDSKGSLLNSSNSNKRVFGVTLEEAVAASRISDLFELPAVIYRCIEYLDFKEGMDETKSSV
jgi:hypothetical protein